MRSGSCKILLERLGRPAFLLDGRGHLTHVNREMERLLGESGEELVARRAKGTAPGWVGTAWSAARSGAASATAEAAAVTASGEPLVLTLDVARDGKRGLAGVVVAAVLSRTGQRWCFGPDAFYDIDTTPARFGTIREAWSADSATLPADAVGKLCHEILHGRREPCEGCPIRATAQGPGALQGVVGGEDPEKPLWIVDAHPIDDAVTRVSVRLVGPNIFNELFWTQVRGRARRARLSPREAEVLERLLLGATLSEIAGQLGITARTVKFHQARVLDKMGADSRAGLLRIMV
jgi:DNA-binding CsgD family transcriptional regulator